jgi:hypothetical protein
MPYAPQGVKGLDDDDDDDDDGTLNVPPGFTVKNCTFYTYGVFVCFVWISEQTAIIPIYSII